MMIVLPAFALAVAQTLPNAPGAITPAPFLIDCSFPRTVAKGEPAMIDQFSVLLPNGITLGKIAPVEISDPAALIKGTRFDTASTRANGEIALLGVATLPHAILTMLPANDKFGGYRSGIGLAGGGKPRIGRCFFLGGPDAPVGFKESQDEARSKNQNN